jgi:hypothetical protein
MGILDPGCAARPWALLFDRVAVVRRPLLEFFTQGALRDPGLCCLTALRS